MPKKTNPQKLAEMREIAQAYQDLKALRQVKRRELEAQLEEEMVQARAEFGLYLQNKFEREGYPYKFTVSDFMAAMGTKDRPTVNEFLGEARERTRNRFLDNMGTVKTWLKLAAFTAKPGPNDSREYYAVVQDEQTGISWRAFTSGLKTRYTITQIDPDKDLLDEKNWLMNEFMGKEYKRPLDGSAPEWLQWLDEQPEWLEEMGEA